MKAYQILDYNAAPEVTEVADPVPAKGEVLVDIAACGLNFGDLLMAKGQYQEKPPLPLTLGMEAAGTVVALGPDTDGPAPGTRVALSGGQGGLAEKGVFAADKCMPIPDSMSFVHAAAFQVAYGTSYVGLAKRAHLQKGETLLVLGAAGGVGLTAIEIGKLMGATVIACARGAEKLAVCKEVGADHLIDSEVDDIREKVKSLGGADVVYDPVGGDQFTAAMRATNPLGRILVVGFAAGDIPKIPANHLLVKNIDVMGYYWGGYRMFRPDILDDAMAELLTWYDAGKLKPHVSAEIPLARAAEAYDFLRARKSTGKVVVTMG